MSHWTCEFYVSHLISSYTRINKFDPAFPSTYLLRRNWSNSKLLMFIPVNHRIEILIHSDQIKLPSY
uniref:Uncharacterized protein n=1 Tax=Spirodela intermedia TaxID=51605 RepID=A0A8S0XJE2_SPIIN